MNESVEADGGAPAATRALRVAASLFVALSLMALWLAKPIEFELRVVDEEARPIEAVLVRVVSAVDPRAYEDLYTDADGGIRANIGGIRKDLDVIVNGDARFEPELHACRRSGTVNGPTYVGRVLCGVNPRGGDAAAPPVVLAARLPTRQVCRLTGRGGHNGPYQYVGHDSAITVPWLREAEGGAREDLLWWFGDTLDEPNGPIYVPNKMARSDSSADAAACPAIEYLGAHEQAPLSVDATISTEATVWLDLPLVSSTTREDRPHGAFSFRPTKGDRLHIGYLSVEDTPPFFKVTHLGLATLVDCRADCSARLDGPVSTLVREPGALWRAPVEYARAPEGSPFLFGDTYTILKVVERRTYCEAPPHDVDCSAERPCSDGSRCIEPGKFCDTAPRVACLDDSACTSGRCRRGGVIAMQVDRTEVTEKAAYRYWDARSGTFESFAGREPDAILVDPGLGNSVSVMWSEWLARWIMISNVEASHYVGQSQVVLRTAKDLLGPWSEPTLIMENLGGQRSYNPRFVPSYTRADRSQLVYWTATYDAYGESWPMHGLAFDYNVFLYETDLSRLDQTADN